MLLAIDVGNTNIVLGCMEGESIRFTARLATDRARTEDEYALLLANILALRGWRSGRSRGLWSPRWCPS